MSTPVARTPGPGLWPLAVKAGQFVFVSGQLPIDPATGRLVAGYEDVPPEGRSLQTGSLLVDSLEGPMAAQVWFAYERIAEILSGLGSSKEAILLVGGWVTDFRQWPIMNRVRQRAFGPDHYPASTTFGVPGVNCAGALVLFDALALAAGPLRKERIGSAQQVGSYFPGSKVGPFLFLAGEVPADPERGLVVRGYADLDVEGQALATGQLGPDGWEGPIRAQAWFVYQRIRGTLEQSGSSLGHVVKQCVYIRDPRDYPAFEAISRRVFGDRLPPTHVVTVDEYGRSEFGLEVEVTAVVTGEVEPTRIASPQGLSLGPGFPAAVRAEPFLFLAGQWPLDPASGAVVGGDQEALSKPELAALQTARIYENLRLLLAEQGLSLDALVRQVIYVDDPAVIPAVEAAAAAATRAAPPATTLVQVRALWPRGTLVQVDCTAAV